jgi:hypothetical protein
MTSWNRALVVVAVIDVAAQVSIGAAALERRGWIALGELSSEVGIAQACSRTPRTDDHEYRDGDRRGSCRRCKLSRILNDDLSLHRDAAYPLE